MDDSWIKVGDRVLATGRWSNYSYLHGKTGIITKKNASSFSVLFDRNPDFLYHNRNLTFTFEENFKKIEDYSIEII